MPCRPTPPLSPQCSSRRSESSSASSFRSPCFKTPSRPRIVCLHSAPSDGAGVGAVLVLVGSALYTRHRRPHLCALTAKGVAGEAQRENWIEQHVLYINHLQHISVHVHITSRGKLFGVPCPFVTLDPPLFSFPDGGLQNHNTQAFGTFLSQAAQHPSRASQSSALTLRLRKRERGGTLFRSSRVGTVRAGSEWPLCPQRLRHEASLSVRVHLVRRRGGA